MTDPGRPARLVEARMRVAACLALSWDGRIYHPEIPSLGSPADRRRLESLRSEADVVLYGAATARAEGSKPIAFRYPQIGRVVTDRMPHAVPPIAVVCRRIDFSFSSPFWASDTRMAILHVAPNQKRQRPPEMPGSIDYAQVQPRPRGIDAEADAILRAAAIWRSADGFGTNATPLRLLCEGGGRLIGTLLASNAVDEMFLTVTGWVAGGCKSPLAVSGDFPPRQFRLVSATVETDAGEVFLRYRRPDGAVWPRSEDLELAGSP